MVTKGLWTAGQTDGRVNLGLLDAPELSAVPATTRGFAPKIFTDYSANIWIGTAADEQRFMTLDDLVGIGMAGNDTLTGTGFADLIVGDRMTKGFANALLNGVSLAPSPYDYSISDNDEIHGGGGNDLLLADMGNDSIWGDDDHDLIVLTLSTGADLAIYGGQGSDTLLASDFWSQGLTTISVSTLILDNAAGVEVLDLTLLDLAGTAGADVLDFSGVATILTGIRAPAYDMGAGGDRFVDADGLYDSLVDCGSGNDTVDGRRRL